MAPRPEDKLPRNDPEALPSHQPSRRSVLTGWVLMTVTGFGGCWGFNKYGDTDHLAEYGGVVLYPREGPEYDMTERLPNDLVASPTLKDLGKIVLAETEQTLLDVVRQAYASEVSACGRPFNTALERELTSLVARVNVFRSGPILQPGQSLILPPLQSFIDPSHNYSELAAPNSGVWLSRVSPETKEYAYLLARSDPASLGPVYVVEPDADWEQILKATYPELEKYPKTRAHLIQTIASAHGASAERGPEEGRILYLPRLEVLLGGQSDPKTLLDVSSDDLKKRLPPALKQAIALEAAVWRKYFSSGTTPTTGARTDSATPLPVTPEAKGEEEAKLPARPEANRAAFHQPPTLEISEAGLNLIREYESFFAKPYYCCANKLTVGYRCRLVKAIKLARSQKGGLSKTDAECFLKEDVNLHERLVQKHFANIPLTQGMYDALVSWSFNTGALETFESNSKKQPTLHKLLEQGDYRKGLRELLKWVYYTRNGKKHVARGLARRRAAEYRLAMNGFKENAVPKQGLTEQAPNRKPEPNRQG